MKKDLTKGLSNGVYAICEGSYAGKVAGNPVSKMYDVAVLVSDNPDFELPPKADKLLHYVQRKLLPLFFKENVETYPDFRRFRECRIIDVVRIGAKEVKEVVQEGELNIDKMKRKDLVLFSVANGLITNPADFSTIQAARDAVSDEWENIQIAQEAMEAKEDEEAVKEEQQFAEFEDIK